MGQTEPRRLATGNCILVHTSVETPVPCALESESVRQPLDVDGGLAHWPEAARKGVVRGSDEHHILARLIAARIRGEDERVADAQSDLLGGGRRVQLQPGPASAFPCSPNRVRLTRGIC